MRRFILTAAAAAMLAGGALAPDRAAAMSAGGLKAAAGQFGAVQQIARVCRRVCSEGVCRERCVTRPDNYGYSERRIYRRDRWRDREYRRDRRPGIHLELR